MFHLILLFIQIYISLKFPTTEVTSSWETAIQFTQDWKKESKTKWSYATLHHVVFIQASTQTNAGRNCQDVSMGAILVSLVTRRRSGIIRCFSSPGSVVASSMNRKFRTGFYSSIEPCIRRGRWRSNTLTAADARKWWGADTNCWASSSSQTN